MDTSFNCYVWHRMPVPQLIQEVSELFPKNEINDLFRREIDKLVKRATTERVIEELLIFRDMDFTGFIDRVLRQAGFPDADLDSLVQDIVVKLLVTGNLFTGWFGQPLSARFRVAVRNAVSTLAVKRQRYRRRSKDLPQDAIQPSLTDASAIEEFRRYVQQTLGDAAATVLDQRLVGEDTKLLIGQPGIETSYRLKQLVNRIKNALRTFAKNNPELREMVERAMEAESETIKKRFGKEPVPSTQ